MIKLDIAFLTLALALGLASAAAAQAPPWTGSSVFDDASWRRSFLGSYGFLSGAEPQVNSEEIDLLREVIELMKVNPRAASSMLQAQVGENSSATLDFVLANLEFQNGELDPAAAHYGSAIEKFPDFRRAHKNLGLLLVQRGRHGAAREHLAKAIELGDRDGRTYGLMGYCDISEGNHLAAEQAYRSAILHQPETRDWKLGLARALLAMEKFEEAISLFGSLIESDPEDASAWLLQANAYLGLDQPQAAAVNLEAVRMMGKAQTSSLVLLGDIYMNDGMSELAKNAYLTAIDSDSDATQFGTAYRAAELLVRTRSYPEAKQMLASIDSRYGKKLSRDDQLQVLTLKAKVARAEGRKKEAADLLESIVRRDGTRGDALIELASYYHSQGSTSKALLLIERAENLEGFEYQALLEHAQYQVAEKDYRKAAQLLRRALEIRREPRVEGFLARVEQAARR